MMLIRFVYWYGGGGGGVRVKLDCGIIVWISLFIEGFQNFEKPCSRFSFKNGGKFKQGGCQQKMRGGRGEGGGVNTAFH